MQIRVYYEDTDAAGVVYHASYLKFMERARTEFFRERGFNVAELADAGNVFPVVRMEIDFKFPAKHDQLIELITDVTEIGGSSLLLKQRVVDFDSKTLICSASVKLACVGSDLRPHRIPSDVREMLEREIAKSDA